MSNLVIYLLARKLTPRPFETVLTYFFTGAASALAPASAAILVVSVDVHRLGHQHIDLLHGAYVCALRKSALYGTRSH